MWDFQDWEIPLRSQDIPVAQEFGGMSSAACWVCFTSCLPDDNGVHRPSISGDDVSVNVNPLEIDCSWPSRPTDVFHPHSEPCDVFLLLEGAYSCRGQICLCTNLRSAVPHVLDHRQVSQNAQTFYDVAAARNITMSGCLSITQRAGNG